MKLLPKTSAGRPPKTVRLTDCDGETKDFATVRETAVFLEMTPQQIYNALCYRKKLRGCTLSYV